MSIYTRHKDGVEILELSGDIAIGRQLAQPLDLKGRPIEDLRETIEKLLEEGRTRIILNLEQVRFVDSAGLGELIEFKKRTTARGGDIKILHPAKQVHELLVMTLLTGLFEIHHDEEEAVRSFWTT